MVLSSKKHISTYLKEVVVKTKNPSRITLARRAVDDAVLETARVISDRLAKKAKPVNIAVLGEHLAELYSVLVILTTHEQSGRRELTPEAVQQIGSMIEGYTNVSEHDNTSWLGILKSMVGQS